MPLVIIMPESYGNIVFVLEALSEERLTLEFVKSKLLDEELKKAQKPYRELIGCLMFAMMTTRPDISTALNLFSRFQNCANEHHWNGLKRVLRYIKGTLNYSLFYGGEEKEQHLIGFADADFAGDPTDRKSTSGYLYQTLGSTVSWSTRKQKSVTLSTAEAEYIAMANAAVEGIWLKGLLSDINANFESFEICEDNLSAIKASKIPNPKFLKHVDIKAKFVNNLVSEGLLKVTHISTKNQIADLLTKAISVDAFERHRSKMRLLPDAIADEITA
jgi:hypothetical protein